METVFNGQTFVQLICCLSVQLMAMIAELFSGFENIKSMVEKMSESLEKNTDSSHIMVYLFVVFSLICLFRAEQGRLGKLDAN